jgi:hypothetical protein
MTPTRNLELDSSPQAECSGAVLLVGWAMPASTGMVS